MTPTPSSSSKRAFTLLEALISMTLFALVLGLMAQIFALLSRQERGLQARAQSLDASLSAMERMRRECRMAVLWTTPSVTDTAAHDRLELDLPDFEQDALRLPRPPGQPAVPLWDPLAMLVHVRYQVVDQTLWREVRISGVFQRIPLSLGVSGLSARRFGRKEMQLELAIPQQATLKTLVERFSLPCAHAWSGP